MSRPAAADQLRRLLAMIPWLLEREEVSIDEVGARFGVSADQVVADVERAACIGLPPYSPGDLVDARIEDDRVVVEPTSARVFTRPPRLNREEGFAVLASATALLAVPGTDPDGPLARALRKVEQALGGEGHVALDVDAPEHLDVVRDAAEHGMRLRVVYYSAWRDDVTERDVDPYSVHLQRGRWHMTAHDHRSGQQRRFRVDRIERATPTGERCARRPVEPPAGVFEAPPDARVVVLRLPAAARWVVETYPVEWEAEADGTLRVRVAVAGAAWLERLLLRVGPEAVVVEPADLRDVGARAAARLLATYAAGL